MLQQVRIERVAQLAEQKGSVTVAELVSEFAVSKETARRDINVLVERRVLSRTYGGAIFINRVLSNNGSMHSDSKTLANPEVEAPLFSDKKNKNVKQKMSLAKRCLPFIRKHDLIVLDGGSTSWFLARQLPDIEMTVLTNSLEIVQVLACKSSIRTVCLGGEYQPEHGAFMGRLVEVSLSEFKADKLFISCDSFSLEDGLKDNSMATSEIKRAMISISKEVFLLADESKYQVEGEYCTVGFNKIDHAVLGFTPDYELLQELAWNNVTMVD
ncbi:DeoR/GlpR family DNA-binding transcription regulator [Photobacterium sp. DNB22_13_2]